MLSKNNLVGPKGNFLLGNLAEFRKDTLSFLSKCSQDYGEIVPLRLLHIPVYLFFNPDHIEYVLSTHNRDFIKSRMYKLGGSVFGNGLAMSEGDFWLRQRRLMQPAFHRERIEEYGRIMVDYTERMLATWQAGQMLDINHAMLSLSLEIAIKTLFNCDVDDDSEGAGEASTLVFEEIAARFSNPVPIPESIPTPGNRRYQTAVRHLDEIVYRIIRQRRAKPEDTGDLLSMLLQAQDEDGSVMTDRQLRDETLTLLIAGHETTGNALSWTWYLLSQNPQVEAKLVAELEAVLGGRRPTLSDLPKLRYTEMVLMESLRLYPIASLLGREAIKDFELAGYHFPKGAEFWISPWAMHRHPRYYEAPEAFKPERWEGDLAKRLPKFAYLPFSHGPRQCIGNTFATMEAKLVLATMMQRFHFELAPGEVVRPKFSISLNPEQGIKMVLTPRQPRPLSAAQAVSIPVASP